MVHFCAVRSSVEKTAFLQWKKKYLAHTKMTVFLTSLNVPSISIILLSMDQSPDGIRITD